jgi:hypothetical protein
MENEKPSDKWRRGPTPAARRGGVRALSRFFGDIREVTAAVSPEDLRLR